MSDPEGYFSPEAASFLQEESLIGVHVVIDSSYITEMMTVAYDLSRTKGTQHTIARSAMDRFQPRRPAQPQTSEARFDKQAIPGNIEYIIGMAREAVVSALESLGGNTAEGSPCVAHDVHTLGEARDVGTRPDKSKMRNSDLVETFGLLKICMKLPQSVVLRLTNTNNGFFSVTINPSKDRPHLRATPITMKLQATITGV
eukprot:297483-Prorocentrum_minimum.AAC.1